jgi:hypothetical protein
MKADASRCPAAPGQLTGVGNGLACGAAAGPLHPAVDRPLSRPPGQIPRRSAAASRALRGPTDRPAAALDPTATAASRDHTAPLAGGGRPPARDPDPLRQEPESKSSLVVRSPCRMAERLD